MSVKAQMSKVEQETPQVTEAPIADKPAVEPSEDQVEDTVEAEATIEKKIEESVAPSEPEIKEAEPVEAIQQTTESEETKEETPENTGRSSRAPRRGRGKPATKQANTETKAPVELPAAILAQQEKLRLEQEEKRSVATSRRRASAGRVKNDPRASREEQSGTETTSDSHVE